MLQYIGKHEQGDIEWEICDTINLDRPTVVSMSKKVDIKHQSYPMQKQLYGSNKSRTAAEVIQYDTLPSPPVTLARELLSGEQPRRKSALQLRAAISYIGTNSV